MVEPPVFLFSSLTAPVPPRTCHTSHGLEVTLRTHVWLETYIVCVISPRPRGCMNLCQQK